MKPPRLAPLRIRTLDQKTLHAIAGRLLRESMTKDLSERQDWFLDHVFYELRWRHACYEAINLPRPCCCEFCLPPWSAASDAPLQPKLGDRTAHHRADRGDRRAHGR